MVLLTDQFLYTGCGFFMEKYKLEIEMYQWICHISTPKGAHRSKQVTPLSSSNSCSGMDTWSWEAPLNLIQNKSAAQQNM